VGISARKTGQLYLQKIGVNYYKARMYHPKLGRFLQTDPVGYEDQMNLYAYVGNDPINMIDPTGKSSEEGNLWANILGFSSSEQATTKITGSIETAMPSRDTVHTVANGASLTLAVAAVTTPCTGGLLAIDTAVAADHLSQGDLKSAALTLLSGATGEAVSVAHKVTKTAVNVAQSAKRGAATNVLKNQAVGVTQEYQDKKEEGR
jgi:RHS repeat-associated protein